MALGTAPIVVTLTSHRSLIVKRSAKRYLRQPDPSQVYEGAWLIYRCACLNLGMWVARAERIKPPALLSTTAWLKH